MSAEQEKEAIEMEGAAHRLNAGPCSGAYLQGSPSEHYVPTAIATPATAFGEPATASSHAELTSDVSAHSEDINT